MAIVTREFETMVDDTLQRIVDANAGITNIMPGSVVRTIVEALLAETDIQNYMIDEIYKAMNIDTATGEDLENIVEILGVTRKSATYAEGIVKFGRSDEYSTDIAIQYAQMVSTKQNSNGDIYEFIVIDDDAKLVAGDLSVDVNVRATKPGRIYLPINTVTIMNTSVIGIEYVTNAVEINSGTDEETDDELRERAKQALSELGKGTSNALRSALLKLNGVNDVVILDTNRGVGTADIVMITNDIPPSTALVNQINAVINETKSAGINIEVIYPTIDTQDISVTLKNVNNIDIPDEYINLAANAIVEYCNSLSIGDTLILSQMERLIGNAINNIDIDIITLSPSANVVPSSTQVIRNGIITINGVEWNG